MLHLVLYLLSICFLKFGVVGKLEFAKEKEAPFLVSIRRTEYEQNFGYGHHHCSGALIDTTTVVTAASCLYDTLGNPILEPKSFTIVAGTRYLVANSPEDHGVIRECDKIIPHPHYDPMDHSNDIAFMKIVIPFDTTSGNINPIELSTILLARDTVCHTYGWGWIEEDKPANETSSENNTSSSMLKAQYSGLILLASKQVCIAKFYKFEINLQDDKVCAQVKHAKTDCQDLDAGGLLVCHNKLVGVVSIYSDCSLYEYPTVFTHVSSHKDFLDSRLNPDVMREFLSRSSPSLKGFKFFYIILIFVLIYLNLVWCDEAREI